MKRVLVTGGSGIIGRHAIAELLKHGLTVHVLGRAPQKPSVLPDNVHWHTFDLLSGDSQSLLRDIAPDALLHLAWVTEHGQFWQSPDNLSWVSASLKLVRAFAESGGKRLVVSGSCAEYDWNHLGSGTCDHTTPLNSLFLYGTAKDALRRILTSYCKDRDIAFAWGRVFLVYGAGEAKERLVPSVIRTLQANGVARVSHGQQIRDIMSTRDCGIAFANTLLSPVTGALNIASGHGVKLMDVVETIRSLVGAGHVEYGAIEPPRHDPPVLVGNHERLVKEVGFVAQDTLEQGLRRMMQEVL